MEYKIMVSDGNDSYNFYEGNYTKATILYSMAINSKMFEYVQLSKLREEYIPLKDWCEE